MQKPAITVFVWIGGGNMSRRIIDIIQDVKGKKSFDLLQTLIKSKQGLDETDDCGDAPIHCIINSMSGYLYYINGVTTLGNIKLLELLIEYGADINIKDSKGNTPLYLAVEYSEEAVVELLLKSGANQTFGNKEGNTPLILACSIGKEDIIKLLLADKNLVETVNKEGITPFLAASIVDKPNILQMLINEGADTHHTNLNDENALTLASFKCCEQNVKFLLDNKINDVNHQSKYGLTALMAAAYWGLTRIGKLLIDAGADTSSKDCNGLTALDIAKTFHMSKEESERLGMDRQYLNQEFIDMIERG